MYPLYYIETKEGTYNHFYIREFIDRNSEACP